MKVNEWLLNTEVVEAHALGVGAQLKDQVKLDTRRKNTKEAHWVVHFSFPSGHILMLTYTNILTLDMLELE